VVARIPAQRTLWPALWLAAANGSWPPEIDILESWGVGTSAAFFHPVGGSQVKGKIPGSVAIGWHTFALSWTKSRLTWLIDGKQILTVRQGIPNQKMYFIANLAVYRRPAHPGQCDGSLLIRSIKLWQN
jgi:beta-glucanase (GH16 family)